MFTHTPLLWHGAGAAAHSSVSLRQVGPLYPGGQEQTKRPAAGELHVPPLEHGPDTQLSSRSHRAPGHDNNHNNNNNELEQQFVLKLRTCSLTTNPNHNTHVEDVQQDAFIRKRFTISTFVRRKRNNNIPLSVQKECS